MGRTKFPPAVTLVVLAILVGALLGTASAFLMRSQSQAVHSVAAPDTTSKSPDLSPPAEPIALPEADRQLIWDAEHHALELSRRAIPQLTRALKERNLDALLGQFAGEFEGSLPSLENSASRSHGPLHTRVYSASPELGTTDSEEFCHALLRLIASFERVDGAQLAVTEFRPESQSSTEPCWGGRWKLRLWGTTVDSPCEFVMDGTFRVASVEPEALASDGWLLAWNSSEGEMRTAEAPLMRQAADQFGFAVEDLFDSWQFTSGPPPVISGGVFVSDYDGDGRPDVLVSDILRGNMLYRAATDGTVSEVAALAGVSPIIESGRPVMWFDFDNDGFDDLLMGKVLLKNCGTGEFADGASSLGVSNLPVASGYVVADYDNDGLLDFYLARASGGPKSGPGKRSSWLRDETGPGNQLWRNCEGSFEDVTADTNASAGRRSTFTAAWLHADADPLIDLAVIDEFGAPVLLRNLGGSFEQRPLTDGFGGFCMGIATGDLDSDGQTDLYMANMYSKAGNRIFANLREDVYPNEVYSKLMEFTRGNEIQRNLGNGKFEKKGLAARVNDVGWAYGPAMFDVDNDGRLDLYSPAGFQSISRDEPDG